MDSNYIVSCDVKYFKKFCSYQNSDLQKFYFSLRVFSFEFTPRLLIIM